MEQAWKTRDSHVRGSGTDSGRIPIDWIRPWLCLYIATVCVYRSNRQSHPQTAFAGDTQTDAAGFRRELFVVAVFYSGPETVTVSRNNTELQRSAPVGRLTRPFDAPL